jgi:hypothetical protein
MQALEHGRLINIRHTPSTSWRSTHNESQAQYNTHTACTVWLQCIQLIPVSSAAHRRRGLLLPARHATINQALHTRLQQHQHQQLAAVQSTPHIGQLSHVSWPIQHTTQHCRGAQLLLHQGRRNTYSPGDVAARFVAKSYILLPPKDTVTSPSCSA